MGEPLAQARAGIGLLQAENVQMRAENAQLKEDMAKMRVDLEQATAARP